MYFGAWPQLTLYITVADVCLAMQPGRADAGVHFRRPGLHVDRLELAPGADHAALQGVLAGRRPSVLLTRPRRHSHHCRHRTHQVVNRTIRPRSHCARIGAYPYTPCLRKTVQISFCQNFVKFPPILVIFGKKMARGLKLCEVHSISTSSNSHHHTTDGRTGRQTEGIAVASTVLAMRALRGQCEHCGAL